MVWKYERYVNRKSVISIKIVINIAFPNPRSNTGTSSGAFSRIAVVPLFPSFSRAYGKACSTVAAFPRNIASMSSLRESRGEEALMVISVDGQVTTDTIDEINRVEGIHKTMLIEPLDH